MKYYVIDHRYAQTQLRIDLLEHIAYVGLTVAEVAAMSDMPEEQLAAFLAGVVRLPYADMARIASKLFDSTLMIRAPWSLIKVGISGNIDPTDPEALAALGEYDQRADDLWCKYQEKQP
ncbi:MAG: hypothetical protein WC505_06255 [Patescibacteria group bacterium]